jgi:K+-transporting ATPase ATPase B chain
MDHDQANVIAMSACGRAAGDVDVLLLGVSDRAGNRQAVAFLPAPGVELKALADAARRLARRRTPEGRSIVVLAKQAFGLREARANELDARFVPFSATRIAAWFCWEPLDPQGCALRSKYLAALNAAVPPTCAAPRTSRAKAAPLVVSETRAHWA